MLVWKYNEECYLRIKGKRVIDYAVDRSKTDGDIEVINFTKGMPYILDLTFYRYEFEKMKNILQDIRSLELIKFIKLLYIEWDYQNPV